MPLELVLENVDALSEELKPFYAKAEDGKFHLNKALAGELTGLKSALDKEREGRKAHAKQLEDLQKQAEKYKDLDPEKAREALKKIQDLEDKKLLDAGKIDELLTQRTERMRLDHEAQLTKLNEALKAKDEALAQQNKHLENLLIDTAINEAAVKSKALPGALDDIRLRVRQIARVEDGKVILRGADGNPVFGSDGKTHETIEGYVTGVLPKQAPHLWAPSSGGGTPPPGGGGPRKERSKMSTEEKTQYIAKYGREQFLALPE